MQCFCNTRFERLLPDKWMHTALAFGDQSFEKCLKLVFKGDKRDFDDKVSDDEDDLYNDRKFFKELEDMSKEELFDELRIQAQQKTNLLRRIEELEILIIGDPKLNDGKWAQSVKWDKKVRSKQFDEAFDITLNSEKMGKTYSRASSTQTLLSEKQSKHFPEHAFSLSE